MSVYGLAKALLLIALSVAVAANDSCNQECEVLVHIDSGPVCGRILLAENTTKYYSFRGLPYAKPPLGERRFKELEEPDPWTEPYHALEEGPACPQKDIIYGSIPVQSKGMSEDCMFVNVHVPATAKLNSESDCEREGIPILVVVHGGGFQTGSGNTDMHGPEYLILKNIIIISFNYRLNVFGYLSLGSSKIPGNNGLRDILTLLRWVKRNARVFGGNPEDITIYGQSAGAANVHLLTLSDASEGLFKKVILMSGTANGYFYNPSQTFAKYIGDLFLENVGINTTDPDEIHQQLIEMPIEKIMNANNIIQYQFGLTSFVPVVENEEYPNFTRVLTDDPFKLIGKRRGSQYPLLFGYVDNEMQFFKWALMQLDIMTRVTNNYQVILTPRLAFSLSEDKAPMYSDLIKERYFNGTPTLDKFLNCFSDAFFYYPAMKYAQWRTASDGAPVYMYRYGYKSEFSVIKRALWEIYDGAAHCEDMTYIFRTNTLLGDHVSFPPQTNDDHMKDWMTTFIDNFIRCSNPTCMEDDVSPWPPVSQDKLQFQVIEESKVYLMAQLSDDEIDMVKFYDNIDNDARDIDQLLGVTI